MKSAILINGVSLPHHVFDAAIQWAIPKHSFLTAIFVYQSKLKYPFHGWPRNKAITRFMSGDLYAEGNLIELIDRHLQYAISCCALHHIVCEVVVIKNPTFSSIDEHLRNAEKIFADRDTFTRPEDFAYTPFTSADLELQYAEKIIWSSRKIASDTKKALRH